MFETIKLRNLYSILIEHMFFLKIRNEIGIDKIKNPDEDSPGFLGNKLWLYFSIYNILVFQHPPPATATFVLRCTGTGFFSNAGLITPPSFGAAISA